MKYRQHLIVDSTIWVPMLLNIAPKLVFWWVTSFARFDDTSLSAESSASFTMEAEVFADSCISVKNARTPSLSPPRAPIHVRKVCYRPSRALAPAFWFCANAGSRRRPCPLRKRQRG